MFDSFILVCTILLMIKNVRMIMMETNNKRKFQVPKDWIENTQEMTSQGALLDAFKDGMEGKVLH